MTPHNELLDAAQKYLKKKRTEGIDITLERGLGQGQDGAVWEVKVNTAIRAIKAFELSATFQRELQCYQRLNERGISELNGFAVPELAGYDETLLVVEMSVVKIPYILDFGKAHVDHNPWSKEEMQIWEEHQRSEWENDYYWEIARDLVYELRRLGIYYMDPNPRNIGIPGWEDEPL